MNQELRPTPAERLHRFHSHHHRHGIVPGLMVITLGVLLLLRELGMLPASLRVVDFWPLLLVGFGLSHLIRARGMGSMLMGTVVGLFGVGLLVEKLGFIEMGAVHFWPVVIVAIGVAILWRGLTRSNNHRHLCNESVSVGELKRSVTMSGAKLVVDTPTFTGGTLSVTMGGMEVDLRRALMVQESAVLDVDMMMGGLEMRVPSHWQVVNEIQPFMGAVEDKTEPVPDSTGVLKKLILRGSITMGAVATKN